MLILLSIGLLFDAATGPSRIVMMMTGHERDYVRIFGAIMLVGMVVAGRGDPGLRAASARRAVNMALADRRAGRDRLVEPAAYRARHQPLGLS